MIMATNASQLEALKDTMSRCVGLLVMLTMITWLGCYSFGVSASVPSNSYPPSIHNDIQELSTIVRWQWLIPVITWSRHDSNATLRSRRMRCKQSYVTKCRDVTICRTPRHRATQGNLTYGGWDAFALLGQLLDGTEDEQSSGSTHARHLQSLPCCTFTHSTHRLSR